MDFFEAEIAFKNGNISLEEFLEIEKFTFGGLSELEYNELKSIYKKSFIICSIEEIIRYNELSKKRFFYLRDNNRLPI
jgi:hypothetical protein